MMICLPRDIVHLEVPNIRRINLLDEVMNKAGYMIDQSVGTRALFERPHAQNVGHTPKL